MKKNNKTTKLFYLLTLFSVTLNGLAVWRFLRAEIHEDHDRWMRRLIQSNLELAERRTVRGSRSSWIEAVDCKKCARTKQKIKWFSSLQNQPVDFM